VKRRKKRVESLCRTRTSFLNEKLLSSIPGRLYLSSSSSSYNTYYNGRSRVIYPHTHTHTHTLIILYLIALQLLDPRLEFSDYSHCCRGLPPAATALAAVWAWVPTYTAAVYNVLYINILQEGNHIRPWPVGLIINPDPV